MHMNPGSALMDAVQVAVPLNNEAHMHRARGDFQGALTRFQESLRIKLLAYPENSVHICIALSGIADTYLEWAAVAHGGAEKAARLVTSRAYAERMKSAATAIRDAGQLKIALEVLADISKAEGKTRTAPDPEQDTLAPTVTAVASAGGGISVTIAQPTRRCYSQFCPRAGATSAGVEFKMCSRCQRVYYCGVECQRAAWNEHKSLCVKTEASAA